MQIESLSSLPAIEDFLDDYQRDGLGGYQPTRLSSGNGSSSQLFDMPSRVPAMLDCMAMPNPSSRGQGGLYVSKKISPPPQWVVTPLGDSMQRVASCFTEALSARLAATLSTKPSTSTAKPFSPYPPNSMEILKIYQILYQACPYVKFAHFTANQAIFEAFEAEERVHVIDLDILQGYQWPAFMQALAARPGGAPFSGSPESAPP
ncbi:hypothetical protein GH714_032066 [Hevea brasiliensis]|uniref:Uncharacterized protein n=1 Tax=Hevea brasiliensis TaxID=3981 RepID=A0A6A6NBV8_HEVBR|nr:hypothetical protein GH714_032066 [Hevea brasiliensis]